MAAYGEAMAATREAATRQQQQPQQQYGAPATQYGAPQYGAPAQGQAPQYGAQGGLPPPWQVVHAPGQPRPYYYNPATGVTTWEPPPPQPSYAPPAQPYGAYARPYAAPPAQSYGATQAAAAARRAVRRPASKPVRRRGHPAVPDDAALRRRRDRTGRGAAADRLGGQDRRRTGRGGALRPGIPAAGAGGSAATAGRGGAGPGPRGHDARLDDTGYQAGRAVGAAGGRGAARRCQRG